MQVDINAVLGHMETASGAVAGRLLRENAVLKAQLDAAHAQITAYQAQLDALHARDEAVPQT